MKSFVCCRSVISYKTDQKPLFSTDTVANAGSFGWTSLTDFRRLVNLVKYSTCLLYLQSPWASMMTSMLMCWGTTRSLLWSTSSTWPWGSPPPASRAPGWLLWTAPARMPVRLFWLTHFVEPSLLLFLFFSLRMHYHKIFNLYETKGPLHQHRDGCYVRYTIWKLSFCKTVGIYLYIPEYWPVF